MKENYKILVVDDEPELRKAIITILAKENYKAIEASDGEQACRLALSENVDMILLDVKMPNMDGMEVLKKVKNTRPEIVIIMITAHGNVHDAVEAIKEGAFHYLEKPINHEELLSQMNRAKEAYRMVKNVAFSAPQLALGSEKDEFIGHSDKMQKIFHIIFKLSKVNTSVLIRGENGTGKELVARAVHYNSPRKDKVFVPVNCSAIPENLVESEFFGHEKGAFTGADSRKIGRFQYAAGGTIFLDEIGDIPLSIQVKLLRVLQDRTFVPVGANREVKTDVRIIAATNRNLEELIKRGLFREDLFYRLNVLPIFLPSLRERLDDIPYLVEYFIVKFNKLHNRKMIDITEPALNVLKSATWPGNIRELENVIEHSFVIETRNKITVESLPDYLKVRAQRDINLDLDYQNQKERFEKEFIINALKTFRGRINQTVEHANIPKNTLLRKMKKYGIDPKDYEE